MTAHLSLVPSPAPDLSGLTREQLVERLAEAEHLVEELRGQRNDAVGIALDARRVIGSRDVLIGQLVAELVTARLRVKDLEALRDLNTRVLDRMRAVVQGGRVPAEGA